MLDGIPEGARLIRLVIAYEAKQSSAASAFLDCFVAPLLALTIERGP